jgi:DNA-binding response OmpR family regulator
MGIEFLDLNHECLQLIETFIAEKIANGEVMPKVQHAKRLSVLIVDDDAACRTLAAQPFRLRGDYVRVANDGFDALALCLKEPPDLIVSDVNMPRMDGWNLLRMVRARPTLVSVPFIFLTTLSGEEERLRGYQLGVDDYVGKPFRGKELQARVDRIMERTQRTTHALAEKKSLRGDLEQVSLPSVLAFLELEKKTGELLVVAERTAHLYLRDGRLVRIDVDGITASVALMDVVYNVLSWRVGQFELAVRDVPYEDTLKMSITQLLLEHARFSDEGER